MFDSIWDDNLFYWQILIEEIQEIQGDCKEEEPSEIGEVRVWVLVLKKHDVVKFIRDWDWSFAPTTYYDRPSDISLKIDEYKLDNTKDGKAFYNYVEIEK